MNAPQEQSEMEAGIPTYLDFLTVLPALERWNYIEVSKSIKEQSLSRNNFSLIYDKGLYSTSSWLLLRSAPHPSIAKRTVLRIEYVSERS